MGQEVGILLFHNWRLVNVYFILSDKSEKKQKVYASKVITIFGGS